MSCFDHNPEYRLTWRRLYNCSACMVCFSQSNLYVCSDCKMISFCSDEHEDLDSQLHTELCHYLTSVMPVFLRNLHMFPKTSFGYNLALTLEKLMCRDLEKHELHAAFYPPLCKYCFSGKNLYYCQKCKCVYYCSKEHEMKDAPEHILRCEEFKISFMMDKYSDTYWLKDICFRPERIATGSVELNKTIDIIKMVSATHFLRNIHIFQMKLLPQDDLMTCAGITIAKLLGPGLNILRALRDLKISKRNVVVQAIGVTEVENAAPWPIITQIIKYFIKDIEKISYYMTDALDTFLTFADSKTKDCKVKVYPLEYGRIGQTLPRPNLVCCFNKSYFPMSYTSCLNEYVASSLKYSGTGLICTDFTAVILNKTKKVLLDTVSDLNLVEDTHENRFQELHPMKTPELYLFEDIVYPHRYAFLARVQ